MNEQTATISHARDTMLDLLIRFGPRLLTAVLILLFGPVSGAHLNPVVTVADWLARRHANSRIGGGRVVAYTVSRLSVGSSERCSATT